MKRNKIPKRQKRGSFTFAPFKFYEKLTTCVHFMKSQPCLFFCFLERFLISSHFYGFKTRTALLRGSWGRQLANQSPTRGEHSRRCCEYKRSEFPKKVQLNNLGFYFRAEIPESKRCRATREFDSSRCRVSLSRGERPGSAVVKRA